MPKRVAVRIAIGIMAAACAVPGRAQLAPQPSAAQTYPKLLTAADLRERFAVAYTTYSAGNFGPKTYAVYFTPDGKIKFRSPDMSDTGTWRITDDGHLCTKY